jgi:hypothetical protein
VLLRRIVLKELNLPLQCLDWSMPEPTHDFGPTHEELYMIVKSY